MGHELSTFNKAETSKCKYALLRKTVYKNQGWEAIHQKYKAKENTNRHNPKKK
jgi:hypothetical protein